MGSYIGTMMGILVGDSAGTTRQLLRKKRIYG